MHLDSTTLVLIVLVALGTYSLRVSGLLLSNVLSKNPRVKLFLEFLPGTLLLSLVVPSIIKEGIVGVVATLLIAFIMFKTKNILLSMVLAVLFVALCRNIF